jgi:glycine oxidase
MSYPPNGEHSPDVIVVGAGVIGLAIAWRAARSGLRVSVVDPAAGAGASHVAAGMLAPVTEADYNAEALLALNLASATRYPDFVAELEQDSGIDPAYRAIGTLLVAFDADDLAAVTELHAFQSHLGLVSERLTIREARRLEPMLAPGARGALLVEGDHQVDPRRLVSALLAGCRRSGVELVARKVTAVDVRGLRATGVLLEGGTLHAHHVVLAAGAWTGSIGGLPPEAFACLRPVKGQILRLEVPAAQRPLLSHNIRGLVHGTSLYLVPRLDGELVIGATVEEQGFDTTVTAGATHELLRDAIEIVPACSESRLVSTLAGLRPGTPDNGPLLGPAHLENLLVATGHHRNGVLLAPLTADLVVDALYTGELPALARPFAADRFSAGWSRSDDSGLRAEAVAR